MKSPTPSRPLKTWERIHAEKRLDRLIKGVSITAWSVALALAVVLVVSETAAILEFIKEAAVRSVPWMKLFSVAFPNIVILGVLSILIGALGNITMLFRQRAASLAEIQIRLAALEEVLLARENR